MAKNHYISRLIIRRFSDAINIFNIQTGKIDESKRPEKVFYHYNIYDNETEKLFAHIESRVANIIDKKILNNESITLTRKELILLKRYMLICSVRTQTPEEFSKVIRGFENNANRYISISNMIYEQEISLPYIKNLNLTDEELYSRSLKVFASAEIIRDIANNSNATAEMLVWALPFLESYIAFWDTPTDKEFILPDCGMASEYEGFHLLTGGLDISKNAYLLKKLQNELAYAGLYASQFGMYENYNIFILSSSRSMVMINPFFRLYYEQNFICLDNKKLSHNFGKFECPDIWPAIIQNKTLFEVPKNKYIFNPLIKYEDDCFIYNPKVLTKEDTIYINSLLLLHSKEIIGFNDATKIIDSIYYFVWHQGNFQSVEKLTDSQEEVFVRLMNKIAQSPFIDLCKYCNSRGGINKTNLLLLFEKLINNIYKDFNTNPYISEHYLAHPKETINCHALDFLGNGEKRLDVFKSILEKINNKQNK